MRWPRRSASVPSCRPKPIASTPGTTTTNSTDDATKGERFFRRLKGLRRIATRYDKLDVIFLAVIQVALIFDSLQLL